MAAAVVMGALALGGCGLGVGPAPSAVSLTITRGFGAIAMHYFSAPNVVGQETVMSLLMRNATVGTRDAGGVVDSIDGLSSGQEGGAPVDWFYYVNGVEAPKGAAATDVHPGDHIWWDRHDWSQAGDVPAVVGSFPEPFLNGLGGKRLPVRVECAEVTGYACSTITARLRSLGVPAAIAAIGGGSGESQTLRVAVAPWTEVEADPSVHGIELGPRSSGVYARFSADGSTLTLLDQNGHPTRVLGADAGLIAATGSGEGAPVWVVTGTDAAGMNLAAGLFGQKALGDRFAVAATSAGAIALPQQPR